LCKILLKRRSNQNNCAQKETSYHQEARCFINTLSAVATSLARQFLN
jgi:hypothetical protein